MHGAGAVQLSDGGFETIRVEEGCPALERELTEDHNPWEAGLDRAIHIDKGCYLGQEVIARLDTYDKVKQRLVGLRIPVAGRIDGSSRLVSVDGRMAGEITSSAFSPPWVRGLPSPTYATSSALPVPNWPLRERTAPLLP